MKGLILGVVAACSYGVVGNAQPITQTAPVAPSVDTQRYQQFAVQVYGLTVDELQQATMLKQVDAPFSDANLSPLEILGKYAATQYDRDRYARRFVEVMADNIARSQRWAVSVREATLQQDYTRDMLNASPQLREHLERARVTPGLGDTSRDVFLQRERTPLAMSPVTRQAGRVVVFVQHDCAACDAAFSSAYREALSGGPVVHAVYMGTDNADVVFDWARTVGIKRDHLGAQIVSVHLDSESWQRLRGTHEPPVVIRDDG